MLEVLKEIATQVVGLVWAIVKVVVAIPFLVLAYIIVVIVVGVVVVNIVIVGTLDRNLVYSINAVSRVFKIVAHRLERGLC